MRHASVAVLVLGLLASAAPWSGAAANDLRVTSIGTGGVNGNYFAMGRALCEAVNAVAPPDLRCSPEPTPGSFYNLTALKAGQVDLAIVQSDWQRRAVEGTGPFAASGAMTGLRSVAALYPEPVTIFVRGDGGIRRVGDLRGRQIDIGDASTARRATNAALLRAAGFSDADIAAMPGLTGVTAIAAALCEGRVDASMIVIGHPSAAVQSLLETCDLRLLPIDGAARAAILDANPEFASFVLPSGTYTTIAEDVPMISVMATLVARQGIDDDIVTVFTRTLSDDHGRISARAPVFRRMPETNMARDGIIAPLHPAAEAVLLGTEEGASSP